MIKNVKLKKFLVDRIFPVFSVINRVIKKDCRRIFFYCANDTLNDNSLELFEYLIKNGYNVKYKIVCGVGNPAEYADMVTTNVSFVRKRDCIYQYMRSGHVFYSMGKMPIKPAEGQCVINIWHGIPLKKIGKLLPVDSGDEFFFNYVCAPSELYRPIMAKAFGCPEQNVCICGEQKQDRLFESKKQTDEKIIVWTPTFRQSNYLGYSDSEESAFLSPLKNDEWDELNDILVQYKTKMIVKLHPMQNLNGFDHYEKSNLNIMSDYRFKKERRNLYSELAQSDALISDFSSVYLEYLVINRPICFAMADFDEYQGSRGFVFDNPKDFMPGYFAQTKAQLFRFIEMVHEEEDPYYESRSKVREEVHFYKDNRNCQRILDISGISL